MNNKNAIKRVIKYIRKYNVFVGVSVVLALVTTALTLYIPILIGEAVDVIISAGKVDFDGILDILMKMAIVVVITALGQWFMNVCNNRIIYNVMKDLREDIYEKISTLPLKYIDQHPHGDIVNRVITDVDQFSDGLLMGFSQLFTGVITIIGTLIFMLKINWRIAIAVVVITPVSLLVANYIAKKTYIMFREQSQTRGNLNSLIHEMLGNQKVVRAFNYEEDSIERFDNINDKLEEHSLKATFYSSLVNPSTRFINGLVYASVGVIGAFGAIRGVVTVGQLTIFLNYANQYTKPFNEISGVVTELQNALVSVMRVFEVMDEQPEQEDVTSKVEIKEIGTVLMENVSFSYSKEKKLIEQLNIDVKQGQRIAIVGPTGCGKSTLINLLMRFYDVDTGTIKVNEVDVQKMSRNQLREHYGMVLQETWLKSATIGENIAYGNPKATKDEIINAAKDAHVHGFINKLSNGYDTLVSDDSGNLSQGQKQLLCIARVMLMSPSILILDEATSSIDVITEMKIQRVFNKMMSGRTSFVVAHRLSTIKEANNILVMKDGNIIEQGTHEKLLSENGFYATMWESGHASVT